MTTLTRSSLVIQLQMNMPWKGIKSVSCAHAQGHKIGLSRFQVEQDDGSAKDVGRREKMTKRLDCPRHRSRFALVLKPVFSYFQMQMVAGTTCRRPHRFKVPKPCM
jgi:hypothetical protein